MVDPWSKVSQSWSSNLHRILATQVAPQKAGSIYLALNLEKSYRGCLSSYTRLLCVQPCDPRLPSSAQICVLRLGLQICNGLYRPTPCTVSRFFIAACNA